jgi:hypothetical protein
MQKRSSGFLGVWLGTAGLLLIASAVEKESSYESLAEGLAFASVFATVALIVLSIRGFRERGGSAAVAIAALPFVTWLACWLCGIEPNNHSSAFGGLSFSGLLCELTAIALLIAVAVRSLRRKS